MTNDQSAIQNLHVSRYHGEVLKNRAIAFAVAAREAHAHDRRHPGGEVAPAEWEANSARLRANAVEAEDWLKWTILFVEFFLTESASTLPDSVKWPLQEMLNGAKSVIGATTYIADKEQIALKLEPLFESLRHAISGELAAAQET